MNVRSSFKQIAFENRTPVAWRIKGKALEKSLD